MITHFKKFACSTSVHNFRYASLNGGISSLLHSVNLILFTVLLVHLIVCISPHHNHHLCSHHLSLPRPFTPDSTVSIHNKRLLCFLQFL